MIGAQAIYGGMIGVALLAALTLVAVIGLIAGLVVYNSGQKKLGIAGSLASLCIIAGIAVFVLRVFRPVPQRELHIDLSSLSAKQWMPKYFSCYKSVVNGCLNPRKFGGGNTQAVQLRRLVLSLRSPTTDLRVVDTDPLL